MTKAELERRIRELEALLADKDMEIQRLRFAQSKPYVGDVAEIPPYTIHQPFYYYPTTTSDRTVGYGHNNIMAIVGGD